MENSNEQTNHHPKTTPHFFIVWVWPWFNFFFGVSNWKEQGGSPPHPLTKSKPKQVSLGQWLKPPPQLHDQGAFNVTKEGESLANIEKVRIGKVTLPWQINVWPNSYVTTKTLSIPFKSNFANEITCYLLCSCAHACNLPCKIVSVCF